MILLLQVVHLSRSSKRGSGFSKSKTKEQEREFEDGEEPADVESTLGVGSKSQSSKGQ